MYATIDKVLAMMQRRGVAYSLTRRMGLIDLICNGRSLTFFRDDSMNSYARFFDGDSECILGISTAVDIGALMADCFGFDF